MVRIESELFLRVLRERGLVPSHIEISKMGSTFLVNVYDELSSPVVTESVKTGVSRDADIALMKALVERLERQALSFHLSQPEHTEEVRYRSNGLAAYPVFGERKVAQSISRENAYAEAIERFVYASWWDDSHIDAIIDSISTDDPKLADCRECLETIEEATPLRRLLKIVPRVDLKTHETQIFFAELNSGGWISGAACGKRGAESITSLRALSEMVRHSLGYSRVRKGLKPETFYEKRLCYFADGSGNTLVENRLRAIGNASVTLPALQIDSAIQHPHADLVAVHRAIFLNQPEFIGGALERFCL